MAGKTHVLLAAKGLTEKHEYVTHYSSHNFLIIT